LSSMPFFSPAGSLNFTHFSITSNNRQAIERKQDDLMPAVAVPPDTILMWSTA